MTAIVGASRQRNPNAVAAMGMGGCGKSTIAAAIFHLEDVAVAFDRLLWVTVGQAPDVASLLRTIYRQRGDLAELLRDGRPKLQYIWKNYYR